MMTGASPGVELYNPLSGHLIGSYLGVYWTLSLLVSSLRFLQIILKFWEVLDTIAHLPSLMYSSSGKDTWVDITMGQKDSVSHFKNSLRVRWPQSTLYLLRTPFPLLCTPFPMLRTPFPLLRTPFPLLRTLFSLLRTLFSLLRTPFPLLRTPFPLLRTPFPLLRTPFPLLRTSEYFR